MSVRQQSNAWDVRAGSHARAALLEALALLQPGQRLRIADALRTRLAPAPELLAEGVEAGQAADAAGAQRGASPALVDYTTTTVRADLVDTETRQVEFAFSSEQPYERWWGVEILGHGPGECDLSWIASGRAPFLDDHDPTEQIGILPRAWLDTKKKQCRAVARFSRSADGEEAMQDTVDGVRVNISVGYEIRELELVKKDGDIATYRVTDWLPLEVSQVAIPADMTVGIGRAVAPEKPAPASLPAMPLQTRRDDTMQVNETPQAGNDAVFRANVANIQKLATTFAQHLKPGDESRAIADGADVAKFHELIIQRATTGHVDATTLPGIGATPKEAERYSFMRAIQSQLQNSNVDAGLEREVSRAIAKACGREAEGFFIPPDVMFRGLNGRAPGEKRDFTAATAGEAGNLVQTTVDAGMWTDVLRPSLVMASLGITVLPGLGANLAVPRKTVAGTLAALTEVQAATETQPTTALSTLSPKRISAFVEPSKQAIIQSSVAVDAMLRQDLIDGAAVLIENQGINGSGSSPNARGIRNVSGVGSVVGGANGLAIAWSHIVGLETAVANANAGTGTRAGYLINTKVRGTAKNTQKATNLQFLWDGGAQPLNGYPTAVTNNVLSNLTKGASSAVCSSLIFSADWSMFVLGLFGGLDVTVDPYSLATTGQVRITLNQFFDWLCRQPGAFSVMDDALTP